jgi:hypothetical protein
MTVSRINHGSHPFLPTRNSSRANDRFHAWSTNGQCRGAPLMPWLQQQWLVWQLLFCVSSGMSENETNWKPRGKTNDKKSGLVGFEPK